MRNDLFLGLIACCSIVLTWSSLRADDPKSDMELLRGTWRYTKIIQSGTEIPVRPEDPELGFDQDKSFFLENGKRTDISVFKLDPGKSPKEIDLTPTDGKDKGKTMRGIYQLSGDSLKLCLSDDGNRPTQFKSDRHQIVFELVRLPSKPL